MSFNDINIPSVFDRADGGVTTGYGTFTPTSPSVGGIGYNYANGRNSVIFEEYSDSPTIEFGEQCTITHRFSVDYNTCITIQSVYVRGYVMYDNSNGPFGPNRTRVLSTSSKPIPKSNGKVWELTIVSEAESFANPPDEFDIETVELNPAAEKHPRYSALTYYQRNIIRGLELSDFIDVQQAYAGIMSQFDTNEEGDQWVDQQGQAKELLYKKQRGEDSFYLSAYKIVYSKYYWQPVDINPGGYIDDPFAYVPYQFWTDGAGDNIFKQKYPWNANLYPPGSGNSVSNPPYGLNWLRQTDTLHLNRTWYKLTSTWIGAPLGMWDQQWYLSSLQPLQNSSSFGSLVLA